MSDHFKAVLLQQRGCFAVATFALNKKRANTKWRGVVCQDCHS